MTNQKLNNLLKDPRTNWKFIWIVVILGVLVGVGILNYYYLWMVELETKLAELELRIPFIEKNTIPALFPGLEWGQPFQEEFIYWDRGGKEPKEVKIMGEWRKSKVKGIFDAYSSKIIEDFQMYYERELADRDWKRDDAFDGDRPGASMWGYRRGERIFVLQYEVQFSDSGGHPECSTEYPCGFQVTIFHN